MPGWQIEREPTLDDMLRDEVMAAVLRSAGFEPKAFSAHIADLARRVAPIDGRLIEGRPIEGRGASAPQRRRNAA